MRIMIALGVMLVGLAVSVGILVKNVDVRNALATDVDQEAALWLFTPEVAPNGDVKLQVQVFGDKAAGIEVVKASLDGEKHSFKGSGIHWDRTLSKKSGGRDYLDVTIPAGDLKAGKDATLKPQIEYVLAQETKDGKSFRNIAHKASFKVAIPVKETVAGAKAASAGLGVGALLLWGLLWFAMPKGLKRVMGEDGYLFSVIAVLVAQLVPGMILGYMVFTLPLMAATGYIATWFAVVTTLFWATIPGLVLRGPGDTAHDGATVSPAPALSHA